MASYVESRVTEVENKPAGKPVDREKHGIQMADTFSQEKISVASHNALLPVETCPLLLRVFCNNGRHHRPEEFNRGTVPSNELQIYTWMDATLKEISSLVKEVNPEARRRGTYFDFALVFPDLRTPRYRMREIGMTCSGRKGPDDAVTLLQSDFTIGDYLDIAITLPPRGGIGGGGPGIGGMGGMGGRRDSWGR